MTEQELRRQVAGTAEAWLGCRASDGSHRKIIDLYNAHAPLARGYRVAYTDPWCATFASAVAIKCGLTDIMPTECSCAQLIALYKQLGRWQENDAYVPSPGDLMMYDWDDNGAGDCTGAPEHVGIVTQVSGSTITVIEGNKGNAVGYRTMRVNGRYIRGYCTPDYAGRAAANTVTITTGEEDMDVNRFKELWAEMRKELQDNVASNYSAEARRWAVETGLVQGGAPALPDGSPNCLWEDIMTREQFVTVLYRFALKYGLM